MQVLTEKLPYYPEQVKLTYGQIKVLTYLPKGNKILDIFQLTFYFLFGQVEFLSTYPIGQGSDKMQNVNVGP